MPHRVDAKIYEILYKNQKKAWALIHIQEIRNTNIIIMKMFFTQHQWNLIIQQCLPLSFSFFKSSYGEKIQFTYHY